MIKPVKLLSVISIILTILIFVEVPVGAVAPILENVTLSDNVTVNRYAEQDSDDNEEGVIISELEEKRTENTKTFRLSDGTNMVAQYNLPVHYKDRKGDWVDYDNSLQSTEQEITASGNAEATLDSVATSELTNASTSVKTVKKQMYKNRKSNSNVAFAQESSEDNMVLIKNKKHAISWGYKGINPQRARYAKEKPTRTGNDRFTVLDNLTGTVEYKSAYKDVDIQCITTPVGVKENIILNKKSATNKFVTTYDIGELRAEKLNDREIALYNVDDEIEYYINALYMFDANNETSEAIVLNILENANGRLAVELVADEQWLNATERAYPVTIDPSFTYDRKWGTVDSSYVDKTEDWVHSYDGTNITTASMYVGYNDRFLSLIKMNELPVLNKGDVIVGATLNMCTSNYDYYAPAYIGVYEATSSWSQETVKWSNKPGRGDSLLDYCDIYNTVSNGSAWVSWDITKLTKEWYNGTANNGVYLKMLSVGSAQCAGFYSSNYLSNSEIRPAFMLAYRNNKGVENYWSYTSFSVGNAGTAHINDYSGALTFELPIASTADPNMPAGVSYVYNSYMANIKYDKNAPYFGDGWRMNMQQTVLPSSNFGLKGDDAERYPYVYTDADGTDHYFQKVTEDGKTKYLDEDGLSLELKIDSESSGSRYIITDKDKNKWYFHKTGLLNRFQDPFSNKQQVTYDGTKITKISDSSNNSIQFSTNSSNYVTSIKDPSSRSTTFVYDSDKRVTTVTRPDGTSTVFSYYKNGLLKTVTDSDGYKVTFTYDNNDTKSVASVQEYGTNGAESSKITFERTKYNETIIRTPGPNGEDRITTCQFDNCGRLTSAHSKTAGGSDMGAESFSYTSGTSNSSGSNIKTLNKVSKHHSLGQNAVNYARNTSFETTASWAVPQKFESTTHSTAYSGGEQIYGQKSLKLHTTSSLGTDSYYNYQDITAIPTGNYYTLSGYVKVTQIGQSSSDVYGASVSATVYNSDGTTSKVTSEYISEVTDESINNGWRRVSVTFNLPSTSTKLRIATELKAVSGTAYFDGVQVEYGKNTSSYNMVQNSSFESSSNHVPTYWSSYQNMDFGDHKDGIAQESHDGSKSFSIKGNVTLKKSLYQEIPVSGVEADTYILSGWAKTTTAIPVDDRNNRFRLSVHVVYNEKDSDGNNYVEVKNPPNFNTSITSWQFSSYAFTLSDGTSEKRTPIAIRVFLTYTLQANRAYFDDIQLIKEPAQSYTYDDDGNLISVVSNAEQKSNLEYNSNNKLTKYVDAKGYDYDYTYDDTTGALKTAKNNSGTTYTYAYESNGFCKESAAVSSAGNKILSTNTLTNDSTSNTYTVTSTDSLGYQTSATYNAKKGTLQSAKNAREKTITYSYNNSNDVLQSVTQEGSAVSYSHDSSFKKLLGITTSTSDYGFTYDAFGNRTKTTVGDHTLATYTYDVDSGVIQSMKYGDENGDGDKVSYTYDKYGNVRTEKLNGKTVYEGLADKTGAITKAIDSTNKLQYNYVYDSTGRLTSSTRTKKDTNTRVAMFEYDFDLNNNMTKFAALTPHGSNVTQYTYGADNLPELSTFSNGKKLSYSFDTVCLPKSVEINTTTPIKTEYTYFKLIGTDFNRLTDVVRTEKSGAFNYRYKYNKNYSITEILETVTDENNVSTESVIENYTYDALDQLTQAVDYKHNKKYVYTYNGGNITEEKIYDISGSSEVLSKTNTYSYDDTSWGDLLTSYNGQTITYDEIGNPLTYRDGFTFSWSNGRRLDSYTKNGETVSYTYDTDGMRLTKTVDGKLHTYLYEGGLLVQETRGDEIFDYSYDANGSIRMLKHRATESATPTYYYYALNSRNDVVGLYNSSGAVCAKYTYDPWGNITSVTNASGTTISDENNIAHTQPFRYRSYYYDTDSGFYYLQSRYYDPLTHRFINVDSLMDESDILGYNLFAYCINNPVASCDPLGLCTKAWSYGIQGPCPGQGRPGCMDNWLRDVSDEVDAALMPAAKSGQNFRSSQNSTYSTTPIVSETIIYTKFASDVFHNAPWDIKREEPWEETIGTPYPQQDVLIIYHDSLTIVQELGNYTYGYLGYNYGIPLETLYVGSYVAAGFPIKKSKFNHEVYKDWPSIKKGYMAAN